MTKRHSTALAWISLLLSIAPSSASAQSSSASEAEALFNKGRAEMDAGQYDTGCPKIEKSNDLDPQPGALFTLAECYANAGKNAKALMRYEEYQRLFATLTRAAQAKQREKGRDKTSASQIAALRPKVAMVTLTLPTSAPPETQVTQDGEPLATASLGVERPLDPGIHVMTTQVSGGPITETRYTVRAGETKRIELQVRSPADVPSVVPRPIDDGSPMKTVEPHPPELGMSKGYVGAVVAAFSVGAIGLGFGSITGGLALSKHEIIDRDCDDVANGQRACGAEGVQAGHDAQSLEPLSTIGFAVGGAGVIAGTVLLLLKPKASLRPNTVGLVALDVAIRSGTATTLVVKGVW